MSENIIDMNITDFSKKYPTSTTSLIILNTAKIGYEDIIETIISDYKKNPFTINIEIISNIPNIDIKTNEELWEDLIKIETLIFAKVEEYFSNLSLEIIKSFIFIYYNDVFDCLKDYCHKNNNEIDVRILDKKQFYLKLISFTIYFNTNIFNDIYEKIKETIINNQLILI
jgi:hypothetical protein